MFVDEAVSERGFPAELALGSVQRVGPACGAWTITCGARMFRSLTPRWYPGRSGDCMQACADRHTVAVGRLHTDHGIDNCAGCPAWPGDSGCVQTVCLPEGALS
jgi:hypothetical protein